MKSITHLSLVKTTYNRTFHKLRIIEKLSGYQYFKKDSADEVSVIRMCLIRTLTNCYIFTEFWSMLASRIYSKMRLPGLGFAQNSHETISRIT